LLVSPRLAANAAPAAICCFFDFAGILLNRRAAEEWIYLCPRIVAGPDCRTPLMEETAEKTSTLASPVHQVKPPRAVRSLFSMNRRADLIGSDTGWKLMLLCSSLLPLSGKKHPKFSLSSYHVFCSKEGTGLAQSSIGFQPVLGPTRSRTDD
jgi:hypothetical protein